MVNIGNHWDEVLAGEFNSEYYKKLRQFLIEEYRTQTIYPDMHDIFNALKETDFDDTRVLILGQDPYHGAGQAHGMAFSVKPGVKQPPSLVNIFKELREELGTPMPSSDNGYLLSWAKQGVLLLNTCLTVREGKPNSHKGKGWERLTDAIIFKLNEREEPVVFILWGANARAKKTLITNERHLILEGAHPSPLSAYNGFYGGAYFTRTNEFLEKNGKKAINWDITDLK